MKQGDTYRLDTKGWINEGIIAKRNGINIIIHICNIKNHVCNARGVSSVWVSVTMIDQKSAGKGVEISRKTRGIPRV